MDDSGPKKSSKHLRFRSLTKRVKALPIDDHRREAFFARSKDQFSKKILQGCPDNDISMTDREFCEVTAVMFGNPSLICKEHYGAQINEANQINTVDMYGDNIKTAAGVPGSSFMHIHEVMVDVVGNNLKCVQLSHNRGIDTFSGAVNGNRKLKKRFTQNILPDMTISAQDSKHSNIMLEFKSLFSTSSSHEFSFGKFLDGAEVR
jgi:hypothetical protein